MTENRSLLCDSACDREISIRQTGLRQGGETCRGPIRHCDYVPGKHPHQWIHPDVDEGRTQFPNMFDLPQAIARHLIGLGRDWSTTKLSPVCVFQCVCTVAPLVPHAENMFSQVLPIEYGFGESPVCTDSVPGSKPLSSSPAEGEKAAGVAAKRDFTVRFIPFWLSFTVSR